MGEQLAPKQQCKRGRDGDVDTVFDVCEDRHKHSCKEDYYFQRRRFPKLEDHVGWGDEIADGVDDDGCKSGGRDIEEDRSQSIQGQEDDDRSEDTSERGTDTCFRLDSGSRERAGGRVGAKEWTNNIRKSDGDEFLRG